MLINTTRIPLQNHRPGTLTPNQAPVSQIESADSVVLSSLSEDKIALGDRIRGALGGAWEGVGWGLPTGLVCGAMVALPATAVVAAITQSPDASMATLLGVWGSAIPLGMLGFGLTLAHQGWQEGKTPDTIL